MAAKAKPSEEAQAAEGLPKTFLAGENIMDGNGKIVVEKGQEVTPGKDLDPVYCRDNPGVVGPEASDGKACEDFRRAHGLE